MKHEITKGLRRDIIHVLTYFKDGLEDVKAGSGEDQPKLKEIKSILNRLSPKRKPKYKPAYCKCKNRTASYGSKYFGYKCSNCHNLIK